MKSLGNFIFESQQLPADQMFEILIKYFDKDGNVQLVLEHFLQKCFDEAATNEFSTAVGDAINNIYEENLK